jgi:hypothetical protein
VAHHTQLVCSVEHAISGAPPHVAVERDLQWRRNAALDLELLEVLDALARCLDLNDRGFSIRDCIGEKNEPLS